MLSLGCTHSNAKTLPCSSDLTPAEIIICFSPQGSPSNIHPHLLCGVGVDVLGRQKQRSLLPEQAVNPEIKIVSVLYDIQSEAVEHPWTKMFNFISVVQ